MSPSDVDKAISHLKKDKVFAKIIKEFPKPKIVKGKDHFLALVSHIIYQQLSGKAAGTIESRFLALFKNKKLEPKAVLRLKESDFKKVGISSQKMRYLIDLSEKFLDGTIDTKNFNQATDEDIKSHLVSVKGIGSWTADMFLIFTLSRKDILPVGDLGIQKGFQKIFNMKSLPSKEKMEKLSKSWKPYRTLASLYLWKVADKYKQ